MNIKITLKYENIILVKFIFCIILPKFIVVIASNIFHKFMRYMIKFMIVKIKKGEKMNNYFLSYYCL